MQKRFNEFNIKAIITEDINYSDFENIGLMYVINDRYRQTIEDIEANYQAHLPLDILAMIWDEKFILKGLTKNLNSTLEKVESSVEQLDLNK